MIDSYGRSLRYGLQKKRPMTGSQVRARLAKAIATGNIASRKLADDIAFHLTDWSDDLDRFYLAVHNIEKISDAELLDVIMRLVGHAPSHLAAAFRLLYGLPVTDVFEVGAVSEGNKPDEARARPTGRPAKKQVRRRGR